MSKKWIKENANYILIFEPYYEEVRVAEIYKLKNEEGWFYSSELLKAECEMLESNDVDNAKKEIEDMIISHYQDERNYYQELFEKFSAKE